MECKTWDFLSNGYAASIIMMRACLQVAAAPYVLLEVDRSLEMVNVIVDRVLQITGYLGNTNASRSLRYAISYAVLCYAMLCYAMLCHAMLCGAIILMSPSAFAMPLPPLPTRSQFPTACGFQNTFPGSTTFLMLTSFAYVALS